MIEVNDISKSFGAVKAVDGISFQMTKGEVVGFLGPNGAGKTTTMRLLTGYLSPTSGTCTIAGIDISGNSFEARKKIGYLPESASLYGDMEVTDYLNYLGALRGLKKSQLSKGLKEVTTRCGLRKVLGRKISTLSKGFRQRVGLAQALLHQPEILILDEPTVGLDPNQIVEIRQLIKEIGTEKTILLSTHILPEVEQTCERVIIISDGKIVGQGTPRELMLKTHGAPIYHVGVRAKQKDLESGFAKLAGFERLEIRKSEGDIHFVEVLINSKEDHSEDIFKLAVSQGWSLTELKKEEVTLEDVFKKLTS